jgi:universal stress protein E
MRILCATDLQPKSESALDRAGMLARELGVGLSVVHVIGQVESASMFEEEVERASVQMICRTKPPSWAYGVPPSILMRSGSRAGMLIDTSRELEAGLLVLGTPRQRTLWEAFAGSLAERVLRKVDCPLLIVRRMPLGPYRRILVAVDWSSESAQVVRSAERIAGAPGAQTTLVHSCSPSRVKGARERIEALLESASQDAGRYCVVFESAPSAVGALTNVVRRLNPDLLVLGTRRRGTLERALFGSTANRMLMTRTPDVLVVPYRQGDATRRFIEPGDARRTRAGRVDSLNQRSFPPAPSWR